MPAPDRARGVLDEARASRIFPCAVTEVGGSEGVIWRDAVGTLTFDSVTGADLRTPFDLASLTKVIATTTLVMRLLDAGALALDDPIERFFPEWRGEDRRGVTVRDLLEHASGLPARLVDAPPGGRREFEHDICALPLDYAPRTHSVYSDLGFILLGFLVTDRGGRSLAAQFDDVWTAVAAHAGDDDVLTFELDAGRRRSAAPTMPLPEDVRRGRVLIGEVHDNYAAALGAAGHAGLFGTPGAVGAFARVVLRARKGRPPCPWLEPIVEFTTRSNVPGSSRALGWDTMLPSSSCGTRMSDEAFGHVGFTGTSLWIDPVRDRYFVLLTNRVCGGGTVDQMREVRRAFHDALGDV